MAIGFFIPRVFSLFLPLILEELNVQTCSFKDMLSSLIIIFSYTLLSKELKAVIIYYQKFNYLPFNDPFFNIKK